MTTPIQVIIVVAAVLAFPTLALAQDASINNVAVAVYQWTCANPTIVEPILEWALGGISVILGLNATLKKLGATKDSGPILGWIVWGLRKLAVDVRPPPAVIVHQAAVIVENSPAALATGADPARMAAAASAIANSPS